MSAFVVDGIALSLQRMRGVFLRHHYPWASLPNQIATLLSAVLEILIWGFITLYLAEAGGAARSIAASLLPAAILFSVLRRGQHAIAFSIADELWGRNLQNLLMTPLRLGEYLTASAAFGSLRIAIEFLVLAVVCRFLFGLDILVLGWAIVPMAGNLLLTGWALGLFTAAAIVHIGRGVLPFTAAILLAIQPFACIFYPLSALPPWARPLAEAFPATWIFEGMRSVLAGGSLSGAQLAAATGLNLAYLAAGYAAVALATRHALRQGRLARLES